MAATVNENVDSQEVPPNIKVTLNGMGVVYQTLDAISIEFGKYGASINRPCLEIGCGFGDACIKALENGAPCVIANDIEPKHLQIALNNCKNEYKSKLIPICGNLLSCSNDNSNCNVTLGNNSIGCVLLCRVMHFWDFNEIDNILNKIYNWLIPEKGKIFIVVSSPYTRWNRNHIEMFEKYYAKYEKSGLQSDLNKACIFNNKEYNKYYTPSTKINVKSKSPLTNLMTPQILKQCLTKNNRFNVEWCDYFARTDLPKWLQYDGRENVGLIATVNKINSTNKIESSKSKL